jgi:hypothetical protein
MLSTDSHEPIGSVFVLKRGDVIPDQSAVERWIEEDEYHKKGVWVRRQISLFLAATNPWANAVQT